LETVVVVTKVPHVTKLMIANYSKKNFTMLKLI